MDSLHLRELMIQQAAELVPATFLPGNFKILRPYNLRFLSKLRMFGPEWFHQVKHDGYRLMVIKAVGPSSPSLRPASSCSRDSFGVARCDIGHDNFTLDIEQRPGIGR
jgi:hypothetical protein